MTWTRKKKSAKPIRRSVYLMERKTNRTWQTILAGKREVKIGIAKNSEERHQAVNNGIPGRVVIIAEYRVDRASSIEAQLHRKYKSKNIAIKNAKRGAGSTEFFRLSNSDIREIKRFLEKKSGKQKEGSIFIFILVISVVAICLIHYFKVTQ